MKAPDKESKKAFEGLLAIAEKFKASKDPVLTEIGSRWLTVQAEIGRFSQLVFVHPSYAMNWSQGLFNCAAERELLDPILRALDSGHDQRKVLETVRENSVKALVGFHHRGTSTSRSANAGLKNLEPTS